MSLQFGVQTAGSVKKEKNKNNKKRQALFSLQSVAGGFSYVSPGLWAGVIYSIGI